MALRHVFGKGSQDRVARGMAVAVVDLLEAVEVEEEQSERSALPLAAIDFRFDAGLRKAAVVKAGERVKHGHAVQSFRAGLLLLDFRAKVFDPELLPERVDVEKKHQADQAPDGEVDVELAGTRLREAAREA